MSDEPVLEICDVVRAYPGRRAVDGASFTLPRGGISCLLGPSGCGKSSLLRLIAGLEPVDAGTIRLRGETVAAAGLTVAPERRGVGLVFQDNALFPHLDVAANVGFGLAGLAAEDRRARVAALLDRFHIAHLAAAWPHMLSGGEQQRVAIARALAREPSLLLLDEPFSGLDGHLREAVRDALLADLRSAGTSVLIVTHDPEEAMMIADKLVLMAEGRILQTGKPQDCYHRPVSIAAARLLGDLVVTEAVVTGGVATTPFGAVPTPNAPDGTARLVVRPDALIPGASGLPATVTRSRFAGGFYLVDATGAGGRHVSYRCAGDPPAAGAPVTLTLRADAPAMIVPADE
ncbi:ABC transporter ATP-binding protein [Sphingopyxis solisilvae]|uniref:ABC transporter ATP-binding protein n=1 Tax=Sphingopyxis solisilvae TaxID=1886788 RepID=UPI001892C4EE|nr:ABC transporter ATP-binding protein [Sphingopyxis solisilvae]